jgi:hypothetical protein
MATCTIYGSLRRRNPCIWHKRVLFWLAPLDFHPDLFMSYSQINPGDPAVYFLQRAIWPVRHFACQEVREQRQG